jgi:hypothetical protein
VAPRIAELSVVPTETPSDADDRAVATQSLELEVRRLGVPVALLRTQADPSDSESLHHLLIGAVKRHGCQPSEVDDFELTRQIDRHGRTPRRWKKTTIPDPAAAHRPA